MDRLMKAQLVSMGLKSEKVGEALALAMIETMDVEDLFDVFEAFTFNVNLHALQQDPDAHGPATEGCDCMACRIKRLVKPGQPEQPAHADHVKTRLN